GLQPLPGLGDAQEVRSDPGVEERGHRHGDGRHDRRRPAAWISWAKECVVMKLRGRVAVVTGASRGVGKGIALALGEAGATVYVTGRSEQGGTTEGLPGTVRETAEAVTQRGGQGVAVRCDHTADAEVEALFARVAQEQGRLDLLVNNVWGGYEQ